MSTRHITGPAQKKYIEDTMHVKSRNTGRRFPQKKKMPVWEEAVWLGALRCSLQLPGGPTLMRGGKGVKARGRNGLQFL